jgi:hypothetical protein
VTAGIKVEKSENILRKDPNNHYLYPIDKLEFNPARELRMKKHAEQIMIP